MARRYELPILWRGGPKPFPSPFRPSKISSKLSVLFNLIESLYQVIFEEPREKMLSLLLDPPTIVNNVPNLSDGSTISSENLFFAAMQQSKLRTMKATEGITRATTVTLFPC